MAQWAGGEAKKRFGSGRAAAVGAVTRTSKKFPAEREDGVAGLRDERGFLRECDAGFGRGRGREEAAGVFRFTP